MSLDGSLVDGFGRIHDDLRLSVTESCNFRCVYCMEDSNTDFLSKKEFLSPSQLKHLLKVFKELGVTSVRITGGEPLIRKEIIQIVWAISEIGFDDIALTTNGTYLRKYAVDLKNAGLKRINLSIDSLNDEKFKKIRRRGDLQTVLDGFTAALDTGFDEIKVNVVAIRGINDDEILDFIDFSSKYGVTVRFIELMPVGATDIYRDENVMPKADILKAVTSKWDIVENRRDNSPAVTYCGVDAQFKFGIISSMTEPFCDTCNRIRLTADGHLRNCLFSTSEISLGDMLNQGCGNDEIIRAIRSEIFRKKRGHGTNSLGYVIPNKPIYKVGG